MTSALRRLMQLTVGGACTAAAGYQVGKWSNLKGDGDTSKVSAPQTKPTEVLTSEYQPSKLWDYNWDRRQPDKLVKPPKKNLTDDEKDSYLKAETKKMKSKATRHLILIRHGQYNIDGDTDNERYLTKLGEEQARLCGKRLKELNLGYTTMVNSTMTRAKQTADIIAQELPDVPRNECSLIREGAPFPPEPPVTSWKPDAKQFYQDGSRIEAGFRKYFHRAEPDQSEDSYEIIVCHANVIRYYVCRALQLPPEAWLRISLKHASLTHVVMRPSGTVTVYELGESGFMPQDKISRM